MKLSDPQPIDYDLFYRGLGYGLLFSLIVWLVIFLVFFFVLWLIHVI